MKHADTTMPVDGIIQQPGYILLAEELADWEISLLTSTREHAKRWDGTVVGETEVYRIVANGHDYDFTEWYEAKNFSEDIFKISGAIVGIEKVKVPDYVDEI